uniref:Uncharacterized protein n=1 Tax=Leersia perrieri TaxID=77586 RepID=A0A0D9XBB7_9ORYZ
MGFEGSGIETKLQQETEARKRIEQMLQLGSEDKTWISPYGYLEV